MKAITVKEYCKIVGKKEPAIRKRIRSNSLLEGVVLISKPARDYILYVDNNFGKKNE
jgi:ATP-dependent phosphoenolpyruvate carboxykinase